MSSSIDVAGLTLVHFLWQGAIIGALAAAASSCSAARPHRSDMPSDASRFFSCSERR